MSDETQSENIEQAIDQATAAVAHEADNLEGGSAEGAPMGIENLLDVPVRVTVQIGRTRLTLGELVALKPGSLLPLDREAHEPADVLVNGKIVARGEVVTIDNTYGVRVTELSKDA